MTLNCPNIVTVLGFSFLRGNIRNNRVIKLGGIVSDKINDDLTVDIECPVCEKTLPRRGVKGHIIGTHNYTCPFCSEDFIVVIDELNKSV